MVIGKVGEQQITAPNLSNEITDIREMVAVCKSYVNVIDCEDTKLWLSRHVLVPIVQRRNNLTAQLAKIVDPLVKSRREALTSKQAAEDLFAPALTELARAEQLIKDEVLRWELMVERKRLEDEAEVRRKADEERRRLEEKARLEAEEASRVNEEARQKVEALEREGKEAEAHLMREEAEAKLEQAAEAHQQTLVDAESVTNNAFVPSSSIRMAGITLTGKWTFDVVDALEVVAGIVDKTTPLEALRVKVRGRVIPIHQVQPGDKIESIEVNLPFFSDQARRQETNMSYRGVKPRFDQSLRVTA